MNEQMFQPVFQPAVARLRALPEGERFERIITAFGDGLRLLMIREDKAVEHKTMIITDFADETAERLRSIFNVRKTAAPGERRSPTARLTMIEHMPDEAVDAVAALPDNRERFARAIRGFGYAVQHALAAGDKTGDDLVLLITEVQMTMVERLRPLFEEGV